MNDIFGLIKTLTDAHTMGINAAASLLRECGCRVIIAPKEIENSLDKINEKSSRSRIAAWIRDNGITKLGVSYRLDPVDAVNIVGRLVSFLKSERLYETSDAIIKNIHFAGLKPACDMIEREYGGRIKTFRGGESAEETLLVMGVAPENIPKTIIQGCKYDKELINFGKEIINSGEYEAFKAPQRKLYPEFGTMRDNLQLRLKNNFEGGFQPLIRAHLGPYSADLTRKQCLDEFNLWCRELADKGYLDILSIGSSQLSQSNFGENWDNKINGGGVPVNSEEEYAAIREAASPMLVRTYSGTKNVLKMAKMYERTINNAWNALSLWWFNELDGRGPNSLYNGLKEHIETIAYVSTINKPLETNVPHHFAFRGCDDVTYIVSEYLAAKTAKKYGIESFILQNMLNTPRSTWGIQDLAKSRAMLKLVKSLEDEHFKVILQTRAGLDYFKPSLDEAKVQLSAVSAMMDDIDPANVYSPDIIHVVSYSEALFLANPDILNESIRITKYSLNKYRKLKKQGLMHNTVSEDIASREGRLYSSAKRIVEAMESNIPNLYSPEGLYLAFTAGWLPVPELWSESDEFISAKCWETKMVSGGIELTEGGLLVSDESRINKCISNLPDAKYILKQKYGVIV